MTPAMTPAQAKQLLLLHSFALDDVGNPQMARGFIGSLRPYKGLREENFHQIMAALRVLAPQLGERQIDAQIVGALWNICHMARAWGVHPQGMLRRNNLISRADIERLESWVETISYATMMLLDGSDVESAFAEYEEL